MAIDHWVDATTHQTTLKAVGWMLERRLKWVERVGVDVYSSLWVANGATKKIKIERAMGPWISMAFSGWEDTTTNLKAALRWIIIWRDGAQGDDDRGGRYRVISAIGIWGKK